VKNNKTHTTQKTDSKLKKNKPKKKRKTKKKKNSKNKPIGEGPPRRPSGRFRLLLPAAGLPLAYLKALQLSNKKRTGPSRFYEKRPRPAAQGHRMRGTIRGGPTELDFQWRCGVRTRAPDGAVAVVYGREV